MNTWCDITVLPHGPALHPTLTVEIRFSYDAEAIQALKAQIPFALRAYDDERKSWYVGPAELPVVTAWALQFDEARLVQGNAITLLHTGQRMEQGELFHEGQEG